MRKRFVIASEDLQAVINETAGRRCIPVGSFPEMNRTDDEPVPVLYNCNCFVGIENVPEFSDDAEERILAMLDEKFALEHQRGEAIESIGKPGKLPQFMLIVKKILHPERKSGPTAACYDAHTGILRLIY